MPGSKPTVLVVDDDPDLRASAGRLLRSVGLEAELFATISDFLKSDPRDGPTCLVLDVRLPGRSGLDLQRELASAHRDLPIIFITGHGDIPMSVRAMTGGAIEFLSDRAPFRLVAIFFVAAFGTLALSFWPYMIPFSITIDEAAAPHASLAFMFWGAGLFVFPLMLLYTATTFTVFRGRIRPDADQYH
jgi:CheY-like chemotaxis protein